LENFLRLQPTRSPWMHLGYYAGLFIYLLASRFQRIAHATNQCFFPGNETLHMSDIEIPNGIATLIEQYGRVEDSHGYVLIPKVTRQLILFMHQLAYTLMRGAGANYATLVVQDNIDFASFIMHGYSVDYLATYGLCLAAAYMDYSIPTLGISAYDRNEMMMYLCQVSLHKDSGINLTTNQTNGLFPVNNAAVPATDGYFTRVGNAPGVGGPFNATLNNAILAVRTAFGLTVGADPVPNVFATVQLADDVFYHFRDMRYIAEVTKMKVVFSCRKVNQDIVGSKAPLVTVETSGGMCKPTALLVDTSAQEFFYGCALSTNVMTITPTDRFFNVENPERRRFRYLGAPLALTVSGVRGAIIQSDVIMRK